MYEVATICMIKGTNLHTGEKFWISSKESRFERPLTKNIEDCEGPKNLLKKIVDLDYQWMNPELSNVFQINDCVYIEYYVEIPLDTKLFPPYVWKSEQEKK